MKKLKPHILTTVRIENEHYEELRKLAYAYKMPMNAIIRKAVENFIQNTRKQLTL